MPHRRVRLPVLIFLPDPPQKGLSVTTQREERTSYIPTACTPRRKNTSRSRAHKARPATAALAAQPGHQWRHLVGIPNIDFRKSLGQAFQLRHVDAELMWHRPRYFVEPLPRSVWEGLSTPALKISSSIPMLAQFLAQHISRDRVQDFAQV